MNSPSSSVCYLSQFLPQDEEQSPSKQSPSLASSPQSQPPTTTNPPTMASNDAYTVHHNPFSICSIMTRMTLAMRKPTTSPDPNTFHEQLVDIYKDEQLSEPFLTTVYPKGQVPAMTGGSLSEPLTDSLDITYYLCDLYPNLAPAEHKEVIYRLLKELHQIQYL